MEDCVMWSMIGTKIYKKCAQVYKLEKRIKELEAALKKYGNCLNACSFRQGLRANSLEKCDCGLEQALKGE